MVAQLMWAVVAGTISCDIEICTLKSSLKALTSRVSPLPTYRNVDDADMDYYPTFVI